MKWSSPFALIPLTICGILIGAAVVYTFDSEKAREKRYQRLTALKHDTLRCTVRLEAENAKQEKVNAKAYLKSLELYKAKLRTWIKENASYKQQEAHLKKLYEKKFKRKVEELKQKGKLKECEKIHVDRIPPCMDCKEVKEMYKKKLDKWQQELQEWKKRRCKS